MKERILTKNFCFSFLSLFASSMVMYILMGTITEYVSDFGTTATLAGLVSGIYVVGGMFSRFCSGKMLDSMGWKKMGLMSTLLHFVACCFYPFVSSLPLLILVRFIHGTRAYYEDRKRYLATSTDGGETFGDFRTDDYLLDTAYMGCNASLLRVERHDLTREELLPEHADGVTVFVNPRSADRDHLTACISFDSGKTWSHTRLIHAGQNAYSSLAFSRREQLFYLLYECGENDPYDRGIVCASFDLEWLLASEQETR